MEAVPRNSDSHEDRGHPHPHEIHITVEADGRHIPVTFDHAPVTGREIREKAGVPLTDDLSRVEHGKPAGGNIGLDQNVPVKDGDKFLAIPCGTVS